MMQDGRPRSLPSLSALPHQRLRPITFVTVHQSGEYQHNILTSECVRRAPHQLVTVDNRARLLFENLGRAVNFGLEQASHEIIVVVREDVHLVRHWDQHLSRCLDALDAAGVQWGLLGVKGWRGHGLGSNADIPIGHWSGLGGCVDTLKERTFERVGRVDDHVLVMRRTSRLRLDPDLPSTHFIGVDLPLTVRHIGLETCVINAPTVRNLADASGRRIESSSNVADTRETGRNPYVAGWTLARDHLARKWPEFIDHAAHPDHEEELARWPPPLIVTGRGSGGSRLGALLAQDLGVFLGNDLNASGDTLELAQPVYRGVLRSLLDSQRMTRALTESELRAVAAVMLRRSPEPRRWGIKLPEAMLLLPALLSAFPGARVLHVIRDPLHTSLGRGHVTSRASNELGRATLVAAYRHVGRPLDRYLTDSPAIHMACTTVHQIGTALSMLDSLPSHRWFEARFENIVSEPRAVIDRAAQWLGARPDGSSLVDAIDPERARPRQAHLPPEVVAVVAEIVRPLRQRLGYSQQGCPRDRRSYRGE